MPEPTSEDSLTVASAVMVDATRAAGAVLREHFARGCEAMEKKSDSDGKSSVVTVADLAAEQAILSRLRARFPTDGIVAEESGHQPGTSGRTWVVDPLDGTANFASGVPWFGVLIGLLEGTRPVLGAAYLPVTDTLYLAAAGGGTTRDGQPVRVTSETDLARVLCAHSMDASKDLTELHRQGAMLARLVNAARNVRSSNCLLDFCFAIDGRFGGAVNHCTRIWDIAALMVLLREAGGRMTDLRGDDVELVIDDRVCTRNYPVIGASAGLVPSLVRTLHGAS